MTRNACEAAQLQAILARQHAHTTGQPTHPQAPHGTPGGYEYYTCRCTPCINAHNVYTNATNTLILETNTPHAAGTLHT